MKTGQGAKSNISSLAVILSVLVTACANGQDVAQYDGATDGRYCELEFGKAVNTNSRFISSAKSANEALDERRWEARLCVGKVKVDLTLDQNSTLQSISFRESGQCIDGICVGQKYSAFISKPAEWNIFISAEEGGILSVRKNDRTTYVFDSGNIPVTCFEALDRCPEKIAEAQVAAIIFRGKN